MYGFHGCRGPVVRGRRGGGLGGIGGGIGGIGRAVAFGYAFRHAVHGSGGGLGGGGLAISAVAKVVFRLFQDCLGGGQESGGRGGGGKFHEAVALPEGSQTSTLGGKGDPSAWRMLLISMLLLAHCVICRAAAVPFQIRPPACVGGVPPPPPVFPLLTV